METGVLDYRMSRTVDSAAADPETSLARVGNAALRPVATEVKARLRRVLDRVAG